MGLPSPWPTITALASSQQAKKSVTPVGALGQPAYSLLWSPDSGASAL